MLAQNPPPGRVNKHHARSELTRQRIMNAAEPLFAGDGLVGVSMRQIAAAADVDLSLVAYHFASKNNLYHAVLDRAVVMFSNLRGEMLDALLARNPDPSITDIFDVPITAWFNIYFRDDPCKARLLLTGINLEHNPYGDKPWPSDPFVKHFIAAVQHCLPDEPLEGINWKYHLVMGSLIYCLNAPARVKRISNNLCDADNPDEVRRVLLDMVSKLFA